MSADQIQTRVRRGEWLEAQPQVYRMAGADFGWRQTLLAGIAATGGRAAASHETALAVLGLSPVPPAGGLEVVVRGTALPLLRDITVHRTTVLDDCDIIRRQGIRSTSGTRTVIDLAGRRRPWELTALLDEVIGAGLSDRTVPYRRASALRNGRRGVGRLVALTAPSAEGTFRSWLERYAALVFDLGGLPPPSWNHDILVGGRLIAVADAYWDRPAIAELDGAAFHQSPTAQRRDRGRDRRLLRAGIPTFRYSYLELVHRPQAVVDELAEVLGVEARRIDLSRLAACRRQLW